MSECKHCQAELPEKILESGAPSRSRVCEACRPESCKRQAVKAKATKQEKLSQQVVLCRHCHCPLILLRLANGKLEQRRVCAKCLEKPVISERRKQRLAQVKAWKEANKEQVRAVEKAWKDAHKESLSGARRKLLIEDLSRVKAASRSFYGRRPKKESANDV